MITIYLWGGLNRLWLQVAPEELENPLQTPAIEVADFFFPGHFSYRKNHEHQRKKMEVFIVLMGQLSINHVRPWYFLNHCFTWIHFFDGKHL